MIRKQVHTIAILMGWISLLLFQSCKPEYSSDTQTLATGQELFQKYCSSCHGLKEEGFGPPLGGITNLLSPEELVTFIQNAGQAIVAGDQRASILQSRYKQIMPAFEWMDEVDIRSILSWIDWQTQKYQMVPLAIEEVAADDGGLTGSLVEEVRNDGLKIELEEYVQISQLPGSSPDLGIVTLRAHPAADGTLFVGDQDGIIYRIENKEVSIFLDIRKEVADFQSGPGIATGIASFDFHPDYLNNGLIYLLHAETYKGQTADYSIVDTVHSEVQWVLSEWKMSDVGQKAFTGTHRELLRLHAPTFGHGAQDLQFNHDLAKQDSGYGLLFFSYGDGGSNNINRPDMAHRLTSFLGTIMRIDPLGKNSKNGKYGIPVNNPFANEKDPNVVREIYAFGFRNPHRFTWDRNHDHRMIATDIGESNIEEINIIEAGGDYGWPRREGDFGIITTKDKKKVYKLSAADLLMYKRPFAQYDHEYGYAISGGFIYDGEMNVLKNKYIFGDIVNGKLFYTHIDASLTDSTIYELNIVNDGLMTTMRELNAVKRQHLRIGYDPYARQLFIITKCDGKIRKVVNAYY